MNGNVFYVDYPNYEDYNYEYEDCFRESLKNTIEYSDGYKYLESQLNSDYDWGFDTIYYGMHSVERHFDQVFKVYGYKYFDHRIKTEIISNRTKRYVSLRTDSVYFMSKNGLEIDRNFNNECK
jgi:hypothetical protein